MWPRALMAPPYTAEDVEIVPVEVVRPLRHRVLRPNQDFSSTFYPGDNDPDTVHCANLRDGIAIGIVSIYRRPPEGEDDPRAWRLRGLAVDERRRQSGVASALMDRTIKELRARNASFVWCSARSEAVPFYEKRGFSTEGDWYDEPLIGLHIFMRRWISPPRHV